MSVDSSTPTPPTAPPPQSDKDKAELKKRTRDKVAKEIVSTEDTYVKNLRTLVEVYIDPLSKNDDVLSPKDIPKLFSNWNVLAGLNGKFLADLQKRIESWDDNSKLGDLFIGFAPFFKMYTQYVGNHEQATQFLDKLSESSRWQAFIAKATADPRIHGSPLSSFLIMPIQRIPRYELLLRELIRNTDNNHPDYGDLSKALTTVAEIAKHVNEAIRAQSLRQEVINIQKQFTTELSLVSPSRTFLRQGLLTKRCRNSDKDYTFFLFNDLLIYASKVAGKYKLHKQIEINQQFFIQDLPDNPDEKSVNRFQIVNTKKSFVVSAADKKQKADWLVDFYKCISAGKKAITNNQHKHFHAHVQPVWQHDQSSTKCTCCEKSFNPIFRRRHHCRYCGSLVCDDCSTKRMVIPSTAGAKSEPQRICDKCVEAFAERQAAATAQMNQLMLNAVAPTSKTPPSLLIQRGGASPSTAAPTSTTAAPISVVAGPKDDGRESDDEEAAIAEKAAMNPAGTSGPPPLSAMVQEKVTFTDAANSLAMPSINENGVPAPSTWSATSSASSPSVSSNGKQKKSDSTSSTGSASSASMWSNTSQSSRKGSTASSWAPAPTAATTKGEEYTALYNFSSTEPGDLSFKAGDVIMVLRAEDTPGWLYGTHSTTGKSGTFPENYVEPKSGGNGTTSSSRQQIVDKQCIALEDRRAMAENEMEFRKGDRIHLTTADGMGWYYGENLTRSNTAGWLPATAVKEIDPKAALPPTPPIPGSTNSNANPPQPKPPSQPKPPNTPNISGTTAANTGSVKAASPKPAIPTSPKPAALSAAMTSANTGTVGKNNASTRPPLPPTPPSASTSGSSTAKPSPPTSPPPGSITAGDSSALPPPRPVLPSNKPPLSTAQSGGGTVKSAATKFK